MLDFTEHIQRVTQKISCADNMQVKTIFYFRKNILMQLFHALIYPNLMYGIPVWRSTYKTHLQNIASYQNKVLRTTNGVNRNHSVSHLYGESNVLKLEDAHKLEVAKILHCIWNKQQPHNLGLYFSKISQHHTTYVQLGPLPL